MTGNAASRKQPIFEQFSLANISLSIVSAVSLDHRRWSSARRGSTVQSAIPRRGPSDPSILRERRFEPVSPGSNDPPTRGDRHSPDPVGRQDGRRNGRHRLGSQPGALPSWVGRRRDPLADAMSVLPEAGGNTHWLLSQCPRCIADGSARHTSDRGPPGVQAARGLAETSLSRSSASRRSSCGSPRRAISLYVAASSKILPRAVSGLNRTVTTASKPRLRP